MLKRQGEIAHSQGKVGACPFCRHDTAELWFDPSDDWKPFQVRCQCGATGPWADCGWESAVPAWEAVGRKAGLTGPITLTPEMIAAAWDAWSPRHKPHNKLGPGPAFREAIQAALARMPATPLPTIKSEKTGGAP